MVKENVYGHLKRLDWIMDRIHPGDSVCEIGCGTGVMIVLPLAQRGHRVIGIDSDKKSILFGKELFRDAGMEPQLFLSEELAQSSERFDVIIISEVLEHLTDDEYPEIFRVVRSRLKENGKLFVTVPNGYGWFELESFLYFKMKVGKVFEILKIHSALYRFKKFLLGGGGWANVIPSTLCHTPHVQRFTYYGVQKFLQDNNFEILESTGSVLVAGPFSDAFFTGFRSFMKCNNFLGTYYPSAASGFYVACRSKKLS